MKLLTRRQIIKEWLEQEDESLDTLCCPYCRDLLYETKKYWVCKNEDCNFESALKAEVNQRGANDVSVKNERHQVLMTLVKKEEERE